MKRVLYGTTVLVTSVSYAGDEEMMEEEMMAAPISVSVGGYYRIGLIGISADEDVGLRGHQINQNIELSVGGETTLDNGITAGVLVWLDAMHDDSNISETSVYFSGAFGTLKAGSYESAAQLGTIWAPGGNGNFGIKSPYFAGDSRTTWGSLVNGEDEDSFKISYSSPSFNGISLSASYEPNDSHVSYGDRSADDPDEVSEVMSIHLGFTQEVMGGSVSAGFGIEEGTNEMCSTNCDASSMRGGLTISIDQISIGGAVLETESMTTERTDTDVGIGWSQGPLGLGLQWGSRDASDNSGFQVSAFNASYALGPGVEVNSSIASGSKDDDNSWTEFMIGTTITF